MTRRSRLPLSLILVVASGAAVICDPAPVAGARPLQTCTAQTIQGFTISGIVCGGSTHALYCTAGALYGRRSGPRFSLNNCTLSQACAIGCLTRPTRTFSDICFSGSPPLTLSPTNTLGGNDVTL